MSKENALRNEEPLELVKICGPTEAEMIQEVLTNNGIESTLQGERSAEALPATGDLDEVRIWVRHEDAEKAHELVNGFFQQPVEKADLREGEPGLGVDDSDESGEFPV